MNRNYAKELEKILQNPQEKGKTLFLHSCCAPCSSYVLEYLHHFFKITVFYYNPNITENQEYEKRMREQKQLIARLNDNRQKEKDAGYLIEVIEGDYNKEDFLHRIKGMEQCPEGGERCFVCYELRLRETARCAKAFGADYFTTTLTISPLKNAAKLNEIGEQLEREYGVSFLPSDFKKKGGYQRSIELSREYGLYRQDYCGCIFSKMERESKTQALHKTDYNDRIDIV